MVVLWVLDDPKSIYDTFEATGRGYHRLPVTIDVEVKVITMVAINLVI